MRKRELFQRIHKFFFRFVGLAVLCIVVGTSAAEVSGHPNAAVSQTDISQLLGSMRGPNAAMLQSGTTESERVSFGGGYLRMLGAPPNHYFPVSGVVTGNPTATAKSFIAENGVAFGVKSTAVDFRSKKSKTKNE